MAGIRYKASITSDSESEEKVLSILMNGKQNEIEAVFDSVKETDFYYDGHRQLYRLFRAMYEAGECVSLNSALALHRQEIEGIQTKHSFIEISTLYTSLFIVGEKRDFLQVAVEAVKKRAAYRSLVDIMTAARLDMENDLPPDDIFSKLEKSLLSRQPLKAKIERLTPKDMGGAILEAVTERMDKERRAGRVIYIGMPRLNSYSGGFEKGDLIILSAPSGAGKSALAMNFVRDVGYISDKAALYLNSEMSKEQIALRFTAMLTGIAYNDLRQGRGLDDSFGGFSKVATMAETFAKKHVYLTTIPDLQINNIASELRRAVDRFGVEFVVVDYIGRMDSITSKGKGAETWEIMEQAARLLKTLAQELDIVILMVAQLNKAGELAKASAMKNECDLWLNIKRLSREDYQSEEYRNYPNIELWNTVLEFRKARNVETGVKIPLHFYGNTLTFTDNKEKAEEYCHLEKLGKNPNPIA